MKIAVRTMTLTLLVRDPNLNGFWAIGPRAARRGMRRRNPPCVELDRSPEHRLS